MIDPKAITTYAQYNEDLILLALLHNVDQGFYVDVGANYPITDSVTKLFYDRGWRGINIEPIPTLYKELTDSRPKDVNLQLGAGEKSGSAVLREYTKASGHSTFDATQKKEYSKSSPHKDYEVKIKALKEILKENKVKHIHFLKIDVEGFEYQVIAGSDWAKYRPEVICIEANHITTDWNDMLTSNSYKIFIADGLNHYYVANEAWERTKGFAERIVKLDYHRLKQHQWQSWTKDSQLLKELTEMVERQQKLIEDAKQKLLEIAPLTPQHESLAERINVTAKGLTVNWVRYKKSTKSDRQE